MLRFAYTTGTDCEALTDAPAVSAVAVSGRYPQQRAPALVDLTITVPVGARIALVGPNGAGKSTLLKVIADILPLERGTIRLFGHPLTAMRRRVAYLAQRSETDWRFPMTVARLVGTGRYSRRGWLRGLTGADYQAVAAVMAQLQIDHLAHRQIGQLSGGQQQRALLARALAQEADLLLLDEPLNAVDVETRAIIAGVLDDLKAHQKTVLIATHDLGRLEHDFDGALYLSEGRAIAPPPGSFTGMPGGMMDERWARPIGTAEFRREEQTLGRIP
ncbi:MAG: ABC transporter ATP-binding protein [Caldilineaceae bacterium]